VLSLSLAAPARLQLRREEQPEGEGDGDAPARSFEIVLEPRSVFVLAGASRVDWKHRICPVQAERWSFTVRADAAVRTTAART
jgi:alkylated DNA repair dioxygenase AlkB